MNKEKKIRVTHINPNCRDVKTCYPHNETQKNIRYKIKK